jgi:DNA polymerase-3 subunit beta
VLSSRLIDGQFPNYRQLLPETVEHELRLSGAELPTSCAHQPAGAEERAAAAGFSEGADGLRADARRRRGREAMPVPFQGEPFEIGFNPEFLRDGLESDREGDSC